MTTNELKDVALISIAYSMLCYDDSKDGAFVSEKIESKCELIKDELLKILAFYRPHSQRIIRIVERIENAAKAKRANFSITAPQLALSILSLRLPENERKGQKLAPVLSDFWQKHKEDVYEILNLAFDERYENEGEDAYKLALWCIENI
ncbi:hypothetical protein [Campylobacter curvus]|uniref:hypothetical protein n=1 Tax=Campylobacter curvus TaxID=200 RepID=UPI00146FEA51|nr:hypothetical protein [Campylobacter curvus]